MEKEPNPDPPQFLSTGALQDPTLRTPGSEIPEAVYAVSDAEPFSLSASRESLPTRVAPSSPLITILIALLSLAAIAAAVYLYRNAHPRPSPLTEPPLRSSIDSEFPYLLGT